MTATFEPARQEDRPLPPLLEEFRTALRDEIEAARRASSASAVDLISGRRVASHVAAFQYVFLVETALNLPDDSPGDLYVPSLKHRVETTVVSIEGLAVTLSVPVDLGEFVPRARLQSNLTHLLRTLIQRIEELAEAENPAGARLLGKEGSQEPSGEPGELTVDGLNAGRMAPSRFSGW